MIYCWHAWHASMRTQAQPSYIHGKGWHRGTFCILQCQQGGGGDEDSSCCLLARQSRRIDKVSSLEDPALKTLGG